MEHPEISIIIPVFNRASIVGETLDSIIAQTFTNWECLITDDGSTDDTFATLNKYAKQDKRFRILKRAENRKKGANACRNTGLEAATGNHIVFFDSDDLMTPDHLLVKWEALRNGKSDFVIGKTEYFNAPDHSLAHYYKFGEYAISEYNFISQHVNWLTYDTGIKRELAQSIRFNENLESGQEFNYFAQLLTYSVHGVFIDKVLTLRRLHEESIRGEIRKKPGAKKRSAYAANWQTYLDVRERATKDSRRHLLFVCLSLVFHNEDIFSVIDPALKKAVIREFGWKGYNFSLALLLRRIGKGYALKQSLQPTPKPDPA